MLQLPVVMAAGRALALHPDLDNAKLEGWREELLQARRAAFTSTGLQKFGSTIQTEAPLFRLPRSRAFTRDAVIKILKSRLFNAGICPQSYKSYSFLCGAAQMGSR